MATTDIFTQVLFSDGEGLTPGDLDNAQRFLAAQLNDGFFQSLIGALKHTAIDPVNFHVDPELGGQNGADADTRWAYCLNPGQAFLRQGTANHKIRIVSGTLFQKVGTSDGTEPTLIPYTFTGAEEFTLTDGDATNPRIDLLQMKLEFVEGGSEARHFQDETTRAITSSTPDKTRRVQCTLNVKAGTPGAVPAYPTPDAGCVPVGAVVVGNGWVIAGAAPVFGNDTVAANNVVVHDQRMPVRVRKYRVDPSLFKLVTAWALSNNNSTVTASNATNLLYVPFPGGLGRLVGIGVHLDTAFSTLDPLNECLDVGQSSGILTTTYVPRNVVPLAGGNDDDLMVPLWGIESIHIQQLGGGVGPDMDPNVTLSTTLGYGPPVWTNGRRCPYEGQRLNPGTIPVDCLVARLKSGDATTVIGAVTFYVAEGI